MVCAAVSSVVVITAVTPPIVNVSRDSEGLVNLFSSHAFTCDVMISEEVDIPYTVDIQWTPPSSHHNTSKLVTSNTTGHNASYYSFLTINDFTFSDSGNYTCSATVIPTANMSGLRYTNVTAAGSAHVSTGKGH